jgi:hypothetical protein
MEHGILIRQKTVHDRYWRTFQSQTKELILERDKTPNAKRLGLEAFR